MALLGSTWHIVCPVTSYSVVERGDAIGFSGSRLLMLIICLDLNPVRFNYLNCFLNLL